MPGLTRQSIFFAKKRLAKKMDPRVKPAGDDCGKDAVSSEAGRGSQSCSDARATLPYIMAGIRLAVGRAVVAMVLAEFFTSISGLGAIIITSANNFDTAAMFVPIVILMVLAIGLTYLIGAVERRVAPWQAEIAGRDE